MMDVLVPATRAAFEQLHAELALAFPCHAWTRYLLKPPFWRRADRRAHRRVWRIFLAHGFILTDRRARVFQTTAARGPGETRAAEMIRRLRTAFEPQILPLGVS